MLFYQRPRGSRLVRRSSLTTAGARIHSHEDLWYCALMTRKELKGRLAQLARSKPPGDLAPGAMCYRMAPGPDRVEYVCPTCGERTLYPNAANARGRVPSWRFLDFELPKMRALVRGIRNPRVALDESNLCSRCTPRPKDHAIGLVVTYEDPPEPHRVAPVSLEDIQLLSEFLSGGDKHDGSMRGESPLKDHVKRLAQLLGVPAPRT